MSTDTILAAVSEAARRRQTVKVSVRTDGGEFEMEVEPYSVVERRRQPTLFCWNLQAGRVVGFPVDKLTMASRTEHGFQPRYDIEL